VNYVERKPLRVLSEYLECFWFASSAAAPGGVPDRVVPDGCIEWIFHLEAPFKRLSQANAWETQPRSFVVGELTRFILLQPTGPVATMGVRFRPGGAYRFLPFPVALLTDSFVPTNNIWGRLGDDLEAAVLSARSHQHRQHAIETFLLSRLIASEPRRRFDAAIREVMRTRGQVRVQQLATTVGCSTRQLEREFRAGAGLSPKALTRIIRFQEVLRVVGEDALRQWVNIALDCGFADQPHLVRDFRNLSGQSPTERHASPAGELSRYFVSPQRLSDLMGAA